ncbi:MAG: hypothetical protein A2X12_03000 [Bacteroidetes bacterium GWE2_29_8]|nr:MAG: hypothetical protein A2X12_03000 [Bacteroidetes bacterium GWE2_29_8]OFY19269.1 MAG: hypothetical protein A2X02_02090 [Bacteroidetes bacterium GWF2_29_10]
MSVFVESINIISSLGWSIKDNYHNVISDISGIKLHDNKNLSDIEFYASLIDNSLIDLEFDKISNNPNFTRFEKLCILSISKSLKGSNIDIKSPRTIIILSSTKGNIELLDYNSDNFGDGDRIHLWASAKVIGDFFNSPNSPLIVSNACISGVLGLLLAKRVIDMGLYDNAVVIGADIVSKFIVSGFQSFLSLSSLPCKPFDKKRNGLTLGEASSTIILTNEENIIKDDKIELFSGAVNNDANHISGPSRTGEGLFLAIKKTLDSNSSVDVISAHGTATIFNDNMESKAIFRAGLSNVYVNSLKGYFGHTLGASGILESAISIEAMKSNKIIRTLGFNEFGVEEDILISDKLIDKNIKNLLKLSSGFGGCNATILFKKHD